MKNNGYGISAMRTSVRRTTASSQTTIGTMRTTKAAHQARHQWRRWHNAPALQRTRGVHALRLHAHLSTVCSWWYTHTSWLKFWAHWQLSPFHPWLILLDSTSPFYSSSSSCLSPSSSSTSSCPLSSSTRSAWQTPCAAPLQRRVRTPWTSSPLPQVMSPSSLPSTSSSTHQSPSPSWSRPRTKTWMTWHSARCSLRHTEDKSTTAYQEACRSVSRRCL